MEKDITGKVNQKDWPSLIPNIMYLKFVVAVPEVVTIHFHLTILNRIFTHEQRQIQDSFIRKKRKGWQILLMCSLIYPARQRRNHTRNLVEVAHLVSRPFWNSLPSFDMKLCWEINGWGSHLHANIPSHTSCSNLLYFT